MKIANLPLTLVKVANKAGTGKTSGKAYDFNVATVIDDDANVMTLNIADDVVSAMGKDTLLALRNAPIVADIEIKPKGFDLGGTLVGLKLPKQ